MAHAWGTENDCNVGVQMTTYFNLEYIASACKALPNRCTVIKFIINAHCDRNRIIKGSAMVQKVLS